MLAAAKKDDRAHLADMSVLEVLTELVESADVIALTHTEHADADELELYEGILRELNPSATVVRRTGDGVGGGNMLKHFLRASSDRPAPKERSGCWKAILAARRQDAHASEEMEEEDDGSGVKDGDEDDSDEDSDEEEDKDESDDEVEEGEEEGKEDTDPNVGHA